MATEENNGQANSGQKDKIRAVLGIAALSFAGATIIKSSRRPRVLGVQLPRDLANLDTRQLARRLSKLAGQVERASDDVRLASAQTKRVADKLA